MSPAEAMKRRDEVRAGYLEGFQRSDVIGTAPGFGYRDARHAWEANPLNVPGPNRERVGAAFVEAFNTWQRLAPRAPAPADVIAESWWQKSRARRDLADNATPIVPTTLHRARPKPDPEAYLDELAVGRVIERRERT